MFGDRHGLGSTEWKVLSTIAIEPHVTGMHISQIVGLDRAAVSRVLKKFVERGLVHINQSDRHSNYQEVSLSSAGKALHNQAIVTAFQRETILLESFTPDEQKQLVGFLSRLLASTEKLGVYARADRG